MGRECRGIRESRGLHAECNRVRGQPHVCRTSDGTCDLIIVTRHNVHKHVRLVLQAFTHHGEVGMSTISQVTNPAYTSFVGDADTVKEQGELHGVPLMMLANKQDLPEAISAADISVQFDMHKITKVAFRLQPCSGLTW